MKVQLKQEKPSKGWKNPKHDILPITMAYPYYQSKPDKPIHRIRSGGIHIWDGKYKHHHFKLWCGNLGFIAPNRDSALLPDAPTDAMFCATCEGRAIGAGMDGSRTINGRMVCYSIRK